MLISDCCECFITNCAAALRVIGGGCAQLYVHRNWSVAVTISPRLLGGFRWFFANFLFDFPSPFAGEPRPQHAIKQIREEQDSRHPFIVHCCDHEHYADDQKARDGFLRLPIDRLKAGVLKPAKHHEGKKEQQRRQNEAPVAETMFAFSKPEKE